MSLTVVVDWNNDGDYDDANEDITADVLAVETFRGRDFASQLSGRSRAGGLTATLDNSAGTYNSFNAASAIYGNILPGRPVQVRADSGSFPYTFPIAFSAHPIWTGFLDRIEVQPSVHHAHRAVLRASGALARVNDRDVRVAMQSSILTSDAIDDVLDAAGWPAGDRAIEVGLTTMARWWADGIKGLTALRQVEDSEAGFVWETMDGKVAFADRQFRLTDAASLASQATFSDASGAAVGYSRIDQADPLREIANVVTATVRLYTVDSLAVLWTLPESGASSPQIKAGQSRTWWANFPNPDSATNAYGVDAWTTPVATTDYTANSQAGGGGDNHTADIGVAVSKFAEAMKVTLTNNAAVDVYMTLLQARGTPVLASDPVTIEAEDATSQTAYGERTYPIPGPFIPDTDEAVDYTNYLLGAYKDPAPILSVTIMAGRGSAPTMNALFRDLNERVTVVAENDADLGINEDFFVETVRHRIDQHEHHWVTFDLSPVRAFSGYWVLDVSRLGLESRLAY